MLEVKLRPIFQKIIIDKLAIAITSCKFVSANFITLLAGILIMTYLVDGLIGVICIEL